MELLSDVEGRKFIFQIRSLGNQKDGKIKVKVDRESHGQADHNNK
jgi:hypothetical protein